MPERPQPTRNPHALRRADRATLAGATLLVLVLTFSLLGATSALAITRDEVLARGQSWVDSPVPYSQAKHHLGYRTDCSGYVSMCWKTGTSWSTATFHAVTHRIPTSQLKPGDAMLKRGYHIRLFYGWTDDTHTQYVAYEANTVVAVCRIHSIADDLAAGYVPSRYNRITDGPAPTNALRDGSFNVWARSWGGRSDQPVYWQVDGMPWETLAAHRKDTFRSARNALELDNPSDDPETYSELSQSAPVVAGVNYRLSMWAKTTDPGRLELSLVYLNAAGESVAETHTTADSWNVDGSSFKEMSLPFATPADAVKALVTVRLAGSQSTDASGAVTVGTSAVLDDISLARPRIAVGIKTSATTARNGTTVVLSGSVTPTSAVGAPAVIYAQRPGSAWTQLSASTVGASGDSASWRGSFTFARKMRRGTYRFRTTVAAIPGYLGSTTSIVSVKLK